MSDQSMKHLKYRISENIPIILNINIQSLLNKVDSLEVALESYQLKPMVISICEHWLHPNNCNIANKCKEYELAAIYTRKSAVHGGVCILASNNLSFQVRTDLCDHSVDFLFECVAIEIGLEVCGMYKKCIIVSIYRTPSSNFDLFITKITNILDKIRKEAKNKYFLCVETLMLIF